MQQTHSVKDYRLDQMEVGYLLGDQFHSRMVNVEVTYPHSSSQRHLDTLCIGWVIH